MTDSELLIKEISREAKIPELKVRKLIEEKVDELSGLVSREGAAYIVARELGISLIKDTKRQLKISSIISGLQSVDLTARVLKIFEPREWEKNGKKGSVANLLIGDETGTMRLSLWNEELELLSKLSEGDVVRITGGFVKQDNKGRPELRIGKGKIEIVEEEMDIPDTLPEKENIVTTRLKKRSHIEELKEGDFAEVRSTLVKLFERETPFFNVCPQCEKRVEEENEIFKCKEHGRVEPKQRLVAAGVIDDGTGNKQADFYGENAEKIFGKETKEIVGFSKGEMTNVYEECPNLGKDFIMKGRVKRNEFTERLEFMVNEIEDVNVEKECNELLKDLKSNASGGN